MKKSFVFLSKFIVVALWGIFAAGCANPLLQEDYENKELTQQKFCAINDAYPCFIMKNSRKTIEKLYDDYKKNIIFSKCNMVQAEKKYVKTECFVEKNYGGFQEEAKKNIFELQITDQKRKDKYGNEVQIVEIKQTDETGQTTKDEVVLADGTDSLLFNPVSWFYQIFPFLYPVPQHRFMGKFFSASWYKPLKDSSGYSFEISADYLTITKEAPNDYAFYKNCKILKNKEKYMEIECRTHQTGNINASETDEKNRFELRVTNDMADGLYDEELRVIEIKQRDEKGKKEVYRVGVNNKVSNTLLPDNRFYELFPALYKVPQDYFVDKRFYQRLNPLSKQASYYTLSPTKVIGYYESNFKYPGTYTLYTDCKLLANQEGYLMYKCQKQSEYCRSMKECREIEENKVKYVEFKVVGYETMYTDDCVWQISASTHDKLYDRDKGSDGVCIPDLSKKKEK